MSTNTKPPKTYRDNGREGNFKSAYGIDSEIYATNYLDSDGNWIECNLKFQTKDGKRFNLNEKFMPGDNNSTDHVILCYHKDKNIVEEKYERFVDAEVKMVYLMGEDK